MEQRNTPRPLGTRVRQELAAEARQFESIDPGVEVVMERGAARRRRNTSIMVAVAAVAVIGTAVTAVSFVREHQRGDRAPAAPTGTRLESAPGVDQFTFDLPAATEGSTGITWDATVPTNGMTSTGSYRDVTHNGASVYAIGTAPTINGVPSGKRQLFETTDGVEFRAAGDPLEDRWITTLGGGSNGPLYSLGTAPAGGSFQFVGSTSTDGGATWADQPLPVDVVTVKQELGSNLRFTDPQLAVGDGTAVAMITPTYSSFGGSPMLIPKGIDAPFGGEVTDDGFAVFAKADEATLKSACPSGSKLTHDPKGVLVGNDVVATTISFGGEPTLVSATWYCVGDDGNITVLPPELGHGPVTKVIPFDQLGVSNDSVLALQLRPRLFALTGTEWTEVALPGDPSGVVDELGSTQLIWTGRSFAVLLQTATGDRLWTSVDGTQWVEGTLPAIESAALVALPGGTLLITGTLGQQHVAYTSADAVQWAGVALDPLLQLDPAWRVVDSRLVSGPTGAALLLAARRDPVAATGGTVIEHGRLRLTLTDQMGGIRLTDADGNVIDELAGGYSGFGLHRDGVLQRTFDGGVNVIDQSSGEVIDTFSSVEINDVMFNEENKRAANGGDQMPPGDTWVLDTLDGHTWQVTRLGPLGVGGTNTNVRYAFATAETLSFGFGIFSPVGGASSAVTVVGRRG